jgi:hypothetical protein
MDTEAGDVSASFEPVHLNHPMPQPIAEPAYSHGAWIAACAGVLILALCLTTTTALVAVQQIQLREMGAKLDYIAKRIPDIPSLMSNLHGDIEGVQELVSSGTMQTLLAAEMQGARVEQVVEAFTRLITILQEMFAKTSRRHGA